MSIKLEDIKEGTFMHSMMTAASQTLAAKRAKILREMVESTSIVPVPRAVQQCKSCVDRISKGPESYPSPLIDNDKLI